MKGLFPEYADNHSLDFKAVWNEALIVFDTNVLLNLYRYRSKTREEFLEVLKKLSDRIWIPHQVALEFQRKRRNLIAEQNDVFAKVRSAAGNALRGWEKALGEQRIEERHSSINADAFTTKFRSIVADFEAELATLQKEHLQVNGPDPIRDALESLFENRVGPAPDQKTIESYYQEAVGRYKEKVPPGFSDANKDEVYRHGVVRYEAKYGDFVLWKQLLEHAGDKKIPSLILVTNEKKDDWWLQISSDGRKTIGPQPHLIEEARRLAGVRNLLMYEAERFLTFASENTPTAEVSEDAINEVRSVSASYSSAPYSVINSKVYSEYGSRLSDALFQWIKKQFPNDVILTGLSPDFVVEHEGKRLGYDSKVLRLPFMPSPVINGLIAMAGKQARSLGIDVLNIVWVFPRFEDMEEFKRVLATALPTNPPIPVRNVLAVFDEAGGAGASLTIITSITENPFSALAAQLSIELPPTN